MTDYGSYRLLDDPRGVHLLHALITLGSLGHRTSSNTLGLPPIRNPVVLHVLPKVCSVSLAATSLAVLLHPRMSLVTPAALLADSRLNWPTRGHTSIHPSHKSPLPPLPTSPSSSSPCQRAPSSLSLLLHQRGFGLCHLHQGHAPDAWARPFYPTELQVHVGRVLLNPHQYNPAAARALPNLQNDGLT